MHDPNATIVRLSGSPTVRLDAPHGWPRRQTHAEPWQYVYAVCICPLLPVTGLEELQVALLNDDPAVQQSRDVEPPAKYGSAHLSPATACSIGFALWQGHRLTRSADVATMIEQVERLIGRERMDIVRLYEQEAHRDVWRYQVADVVGDYLVSMVAERLSWGGVA